MEYMRGKPTAERILDGLEQCYSEYMQQYRELQEQTTLHDIFSGWIGGGTVKKSQGDLCVQYLERVKQHARDLSAALRDCGEEEAGRLALRALEQILFYPAEEKDMTGYTMLIALEDAALPLLPLLGRGALEELAGRYRKRTPKHMMLPKQKQVLKEMQKLLK